MSDFLSIVGKGLNLIQLSFTSLSVVVYDTHDSDRPMTTPANYLYYAAAVAQFGAIFAFSPYCCHQYLRSLPALLNFD